MNEPDADMPSTIEPLITTDEVRKVAALAHLALAPEEVARFTRELGGILAYVRQLQEVDVEGVSPTAHVALDRLAETTWMREDAPEQGLPHELALREAPRVAMDGFAVPAFVDEA